MIELGLLAASIGGLGLCWQVYTLKKQLNKLEQFTIEFSLRVTDLFKDMDNEK